MTTHSSTRVQVRGGFTEESIWRDVLGDSEPLPLFVTFGPLDAPDTMPAGSMRSIPRQYGGASQTTAQRG